MKKFDRIKICIWDFDGTMYQKTDALWTEIRNSEIQVIQNHTGWSREKANAEFDNVYKVKTPSGTQSVSLITGVPLAQIAQESARLTDYSNHLHNDKKLQDMFAGLTGFTHYMLVNGTDYSVTNGLALLGLDKNIFKEIVTSDFVGEAKPSQKGFSYILDKTGLPAENHFMIGDRELVDLAPAKALGIPTCLVWAEEKSSIADITLPTVYDVASILL